MTRRLHPSTGDSASSMLLACLLSLSLGTAGCVSLRGSSEEVSYTGTDGVELRATLVFPTGRRESFPAVVLFHGAEKGTRKRTAYRMQANLFLERGFAVLLSDKRGAGESGGSYEATTYAQLVGDGLAAVDLLKRHQRINAKRIGLVGVSESGWLTPEIAARSGAVAFVINKVGAAVSVRETIEWEVFNDLMAEGVGEDSARQQAAIFRRIWEYRITPTPEERAALERVLGDWAQRNDSQLPTELREVSASYVADIAYDPTPFLEQLDIPMLYVYGSEDINIPTAVCVARLEELAAAGKPFELYVYEGEGHELGGPRARPPFYGFVDGYAELLGDFAERHAAAAP